MNNIDKELEELEKELENKKNKRLYEHHLSIKINDDLSFPLSKAKILVRLVGYDNIKYDLDKLINYLKNKNFIFDNFLQVNGFYQTYYQTYAIVGMCLKDENLCICYLDSSLGYNTNIQTCLYGIESNNFSINDNII